MKTITVIVVGCLHIMAMIGVTMFQRSHHEGPNAEFAVTLMLIPAFLLLGIIAWAALEIIEKMDQKK